MVVVHYLILAQGLEQASGWMTAQLAWLQRLGALCFYINQDSGRSSWHYPHRTRSVKPGLQPHSAAARPLALIIGQPEQLQGSPEEFTPSAWIPAGRLDLGCRRAPGRSDLADLGIRTCPRIKGGPIFGCAQLRCAHPKIGTLLDFRIDAMSIFTPVLQACLLCPAHLFAIIGMEGRFNPIVAGNRGD
jgi:hypothetical protein